MQPTAQEIVARVADQLREAGDPDAAEKMAAYMKTEMPFYGVKTKPRDQIMRDAASDVEITRRKDYVDLVTAFWEQPHREEKSIAVRLARRYGRFVDSASMPLYERLIREGAWWDFVDEIAAHLVGSVLQKDPDATWPILDEWVEDEDMWVRRAAMIAQIRRGEDIDESKLFDYATKLAGEDEFFIRKAIGWALREYAKTDKASVTRFLESHRAEFSGLTLREASKHIDAFEP